MSTACVRKFLILLIILLGLIIIPASLLSGMGAIAAPEQAQIRVDAQVAGQAGPPWYNTAWHYRQPVIISNSGSQLLDYQVLVKLDSSNFDFSRAKADGADLRFTKADGTTEISYWIESWSTVNQVAILWLRAPSLPAGETTIYLYYDNPTAVAVSNGSAVFPELFEDTWSQFANRWNIPNNQPTILSGVLQLGTNTGIVSKNSFRFKAVGYRAKFMVGNGLEWGGFYNLSNGHRIIIRDLSPTVNDMFLQYKVSNIEREPIEPVGVNDWHGDFHDYEIRWRAGLSVADIDHGTSVVPSTISSEVPTDTLGLPVAFYSAELSTATFYVDWMYVRQYRDPEPTTTMGVKQGLVDLAVSQADEPNPVYRGRLLTYQLAISNTSDITASGVIVTDTLSPGVQLVSVTPTQGSCGSDTPVVCSLGTINPNANAAISIVVTADIDGTITNPAVVGSQSYDTNLTNNTSSEDTTVLPVADLSVSLADQPDPARTGVTLTYTATVSNSGPSPADNILLTDTLPISLTLTKTDPACELANPVVCHLGTLAAGESINVVIKGLTTENGVYANTLQAVSSTYDPIENNNSAFKETPVDGTPPQISWVLPTVNEGQYTSFVGPVLLKVNATDNDRVSRVEFLLWDHINLHWVDLGTVTAPPYQVEFDTDILAGGQFYQLWAAAYDPAGNSASARIIIERIYPIFLPLVAK